VYLHTEFGWNRTIFRAVRARKPKRDRQRDGQRDKPKLIFPRFLRKAVDNKGKVAHVILFTLYFIQSMWGFTASLFNPCGLAGWPWGRHTCPWVVWLGFESRHCYKLSPWCFTDREGDQCVCVCAVLQMNVKLDIPSHSISWWTTKIPWNLSLRVSELPLARWPTSKFLLRFTGGTTSVAQPHLQQWCHQQPLQTQWKNQKWKCPLPALLSHYCFINKHIINIHRQKGKCINSNTMVAQNKWKSHGWEEPHSFSFFISLSWTPSSIKYKTCQKGVRDPCEPTAIHIWCQLHLWTSSYSWLPFWGGWW